MKIKLDENLPDRLIQELNQLGYDADSVPQEGRTGKNDATVWSASQAADRFLVTQDLDFSDIRSFPPGKHCGIMLVRLKQPGRRALTSRISEAFALEEARSWARCFVVLTDHKIRIHRSLS